MFTSRLAIAGAALAISSSVFAGGIEMQPVNANPAAGFAGLYLGAGVGISSQNIKNYFYTDVSQRGSRESEHHHGSTGAALQGLLGYNLPISRHWLLGYNLNAEYDTNDAVHYEHVGSHVHTGEVDINWQVGVNLQLGYAPFERAMFYIGLGPEWANLMHKHYEGSVTKLNHNASIWGGRGVIGARQLLAKHWVIGEEVNYTYYTTHKMDFRDATGSVSYQPQVVTGVVSLSYQFA